VDHTRCRCPSRPATSYTDSGLATGSDHYKIVAHDYSGDSSSPSGESAAAAVTADPQLPTVSISAPADGAELTHTNNFSASASDPAADSTLSYSYDPLSFRRARTNNGQTTRYYSAA
jgi:hypothetical protein